MKKHISNKTQCTSTSLMDYLNDMLQFVSNCIVMLQSLKFQGKLYHKDINPFGDWHHGDAVVQPRL